MKLSGDGMFQWLRTFGGSDKDVVEANAMYQNRYFAVTGSFAELGVDLNPGPEVLPTDSAGATDAFVMLFDLDGNMLWRQTFGGDGPDYRRSIAVVPLGDIAFVGGFSSTNMHFYPQDLSRMRHHVSKSEARMSLLTKEQ